MNRLYSSPLRVYLLLGALALAGIVCGLRLPVSLFPNSSKPLVWVGLGYGAATAEEFLNTYGKRLEEQIGHISTADVAVEKITATYGSRSANYDVQFKWGVAPNSALKEVQTVVNAFAARLPEESRDSLEIWLSNKNSGFFALSFFSETRSLDDLFDLLEPVIGPRIARVTDAQDPILWNPSAKEIRVEPNPGTMAALGLFPRDIDEALSSALQSRSGGSVTVGGSQLQVEMPRLARSPDDLAALTVPRFSGRAVHLGDFARIALGPKTTDTRSFKTNGAPSLILYATPKPGGNVKQMSEDMLAVVQEAMPSLPKDVQYRVLVDPSEFIRSAVKNVFHEVGIAALLAVAVLFLFIGSFRNVITAAIEIPMSMVLAFLLMRLSGMNLNLISLGGLALSAGMNVDASVVVMENIFRHFEMQPGPHDFATRLRIVTEAVKEVRFAVIASTIASLVVFLPLTFTSALSYAILGDLALAVVFSHGFSALVALLLVPTVRLHLMAKGGDVGHSHSPIERQLKWLETTYARLLGAFLRRPRLKWATYGGLSLLLVALTALVIPRLPKEIVGVPDTDWMVLAINTSGNTLAKQMEQQAEQVERDLLREFGDRIQYTFTQVHEANSAVVMARLREKKTMREVWKAMETRFSNTPTLSFWVGPWNPSELPIPNPPDLRIAVRGGDLRERMWTAKGISDVLQEKKVFPRISTEPPAEPGSVVTLTPFSEQWAMLRTQGARVSPSDLTDLVRIATTGRRSGYLPLRDRLTDIVLRYPQGTVQDIEDIGAIPVGVGPKLIPLKALAEVSVRPSSPPIFREDQRELFLVTGRLNQGDENKDPKPGVAASTKLLEEWKAKRPKPAPGKVAPTVVIEDAAKDLNDAIRQLSYAVGLSILLIFLTLLFQFGTVAEPILVLISVPLGFLGVLVSLWVFHSTLSLNSILGVILLNGIAVANSIILVDFIKRLVEAGKEPREAAMQAARQRLRPILITSLTTVLGMLPVAIGAGEGGRILQPLGIAVSGGLWVSMGLTLFLVPALQVSYLEWRRAPRRVRWQWPRKRFRLAWRRPWRTATTVLALLLAAPPLGARAEAAPLAFDEALKLIVERTPNVGIQREQLGVVNGRNLPTKLSLLPSVSVIGNYGITESQNLPTTRRGFGARADLNLFRFGSDAAGMRAADRESSAQELSIADAILKAEEDAVVGLLAILSSGRQLAVQQKIAAMWEESVRIGRERYRRGLLAAEEVDKLQVTFDNYLARLRDTEVDVVRAKAALKALVNDEIEIVPEWPWREQLSKPPTRLLRPDVDLSARPDWGAAEKRLSAAEERQSQSWGRIFPSLDLSVSYGYWENFTKFYYYNGAEWAGGITLTIPLFDKLANYGSYQAQVHTKGIADLELQRTKRNARADWETSRGQLAVSQQTAQSREATLAVSRRLYETNLRRFRQGLANANELNLDQDRLYQSELLAIAGWSQAHQSFSRLCHASGRRIAECLHDY